MVWYGKARLRQILALWLILFRSGFSSMDWLKFYWDFKDGWRRRTFSERGQYYPEHLEIFDAESESGIAESQEAQNDFINQQKSSNTNKKTVTDMNTLLRCIEANLVWKMRKLEAYLRPSLTTFCRNLIERTEEKRRRIRASDSFQFPDQYKLTAIHAFNISKDNDFKKSRKVLAAKRKSLVLTRSSCASKNCVVVFIQHLGLRAREYQSSDPLLSSTAPVFTGANIGSISRCTLQIFHGNVKIVQNERKRRIVIAAMRTIDFEAIFVN